MLESFMDFSYDAFHVVLADWWVRGSEGVRWTANGPGDLDKTRSNGAMDVGRCGWQL